MVRFSKDGWYITTIRNLHTEEKEDIYSSCMMMIYAVSIFVGTQNGSSKKPTPGTRRIEDKIAK